MRSQDLICSGTIPTKFLVIVMEMLSETFRSEKMLKFVNKVYTHGECPDSSLFKTQNEWNKMCKSILVNESRDLNEEERKVKLFQ